MTYYAGFDTEFIPTPAQLDWLKTSTNLSWCGYYLAPAPNQHHISWMGNRQALINQGWGLLPIYVGQQTTAGARSHNAVASQGRTDGAQAVQLASSEGFPPNSNIFLDWEDGTNPVPAAAQGYLCAWSTAVAESRYQPGIYCSHHLAASMEALMNTLNPPLAVPIWAWKVPTTSAPPYAGPLTAMPTGEPPVPSPGECGYPQAFAWQCQQDCILPFPGAQPDDPLMVDLSTCNVADPSAA
jgi:hypothetical protein